MSEFFDSKDYGDYFRALEHREEKKTEKAPENRAPQTENNTFSETKPEKRIKKHMPSRRRAIAVCSAGIAAALILSAALCAGKLHTTEKKPEGTVSSQADTVIRAAAKPASSSKHFEISDSTPDPGEGIISRHVLMVDLKSGKAVAARSADERTYPASTTKIMTALVAAEHITDYSETFKMTLEITDKMYLAEATAAGFLKDEPITMTDLLYGTILPSGGDAALGLAYKIAGSEEAFAELMNEKARQLGLPNTHFTNVTGLFDKNHYTTAADLAVILKAAMDNPVCRQVLSTHPYTTAKTEQHPNGILLESTLFSSMYGTEPETATIVGGKTGYVNESGYCIASFGNANDTKNQYLCVTLDAKGGKWPAINDQIALYKTYAK